MSETHQVSVQLLGERFTLQTEETPEHVHAMAALVSGRIQQLRDLGENDKLRLALLAALMLADDKTTGDKARDATLDELETDVRALISALSDDDDA